MAACKVAGLMKGKLPLGPFDTALRQPLLLELELDGPRVAAASLRHGLSRRGIELGFEGLAPEQGLELAGRICARSCVAHSVAFCQALEDALGVQVGGPPAAFRAIIAEYERVASHLSVISDIGRAISDDMVYGGPRRYVGRIRDAFRKASGSPFGLGMTVPGGARVDGDGRALRELSRTWKAIERDCGLWAFKLKLSGARLRGARLPGSSFEEDATPAPAFRAAGLARDARSGESAYGYYGLFYYRPVTREGGSALDRALLLLGEVRASIAVIRKLSDAEGVNPGLPEEVLFRKGSGVGVCESPDGAVEHKVFLGAEGKIIRNRVSSAVAAVAEVTPEALAGAFYEDVAPAVISLCLCAACLDL